MLVTLGDPSVVAKTVPLMSQEATSAEGLELSDEFLKRSGYGGAFAATQESNPQRQQIWYAYALKNATDGWTPGLTKEFFTWFAKARNFKGGNSFGGFLENFRNEALTNIPDEKLRAEMDALSKQTVPLVPEGFEDARKIAIATKPVLKFDIEELEAKAGEKVAFVFANNDPTGIMHNFALCAPGSREKVVAAALTIGPKAIEQNFVPDIPEVLGSTPQIAPGRKYHALHDDPFRAGRLRLRLHLPGPRAVDARGAEGDAVAPPQRPLAMCYALYLAGDSPLPEIAKQDFSQLGPDRPDWASCPVFSVECLGRGRAGAGEVRRALRPLRRELRRLRLWIQRVPRPRMGGAWGAVREPARRDPSAPRSAPIHREPWGLHALWLLGRRRAPAPGRTPDDRARIHHRLGVRVPGAGGDEARRMSGNRSPELARRGAVPRACRAGQVTMF